MKKLIGLFVFGLLIVALSAPAYAQFEWKVSGFIDSNYVSYRNVYTGSGYGNIFGPPTDIQKQPGGAEFDENEQYFNTRGRLRFDAAMGKEVSGTIFFEMDSSRWGETAETEETWQASGRPTRPPSKSRTSSLISLSPISASPFR